VPPEPGKLHININHTQQHLNFGNAPFPITILIPFGNLAYQITWPSCVKCGPTYISGVKRFWQLPLQQMTDAEAEAGTEEAVTMPSFD